MHIIYDIKTNKCLRMENILGELSYFEESIELRKEALDNCEMVLKAPIENHTEKDKIFTGRYIERVLNHKREEIYKKFHDVPFRVESIKIGTSPIPFKLANANMLPYEKELFEVEDKIITHFEKEYNVREYSRLIKLDETNVNIFTLQDIIQGKYSYLLENSSLEYLLGFHHSDLDSINMEHSKITGITRKNIILEPGDYIEFSTQKLQYHIDSLTTLFNPSDIQIYINSLKMENGRILLGRPVNNINILVKNESQETIKLKEFALAHK